MVSIWSTGLSGLLPLGTPAHPQCRIRLTVVLCAAWTHCWFQSCINQTILQSNVRKLWLQMGHPIAAATRHEYVIHCSFSGPWSCRMLVIFGPSIVQCDGTVWVFFEWKGNADTLQSPRYCGWSFESTLLMVILLAIVSIEITSWMLSGASWTFLCLKSRQSVLIIPWFFSNKYMLLFNV